MRPIHTLFATLALALAASAGEPEKKVIVPPEQESWQFKLSLPGWIPWVEGDAGIDEAVSNFYLGPNTLVPKLDMAADVRAEAHKGRFSIMGEFLYMSLSDGKNTGTVVKKVDFRVDQLMADLGFAWRVVETPKGYLDVTAGVRYVNIYQKLTLQPDDERIGEIVDELAAAGTDLRRRLAEELAVLAGRNHQLPIAPLGGGQISRLAREIANIRGNASERQARISDLLHDSLDRTISRTDDWWDPYIGLRGRYNLNDKFYLLGKGDIGGFTVGCDITWTAEAALGCMLTPNVFVETAFRAWGIDYDKDGLTMDTVTFGPQVSLGVNF